MRVEVWGDMSIQWVRWTAALVGEWIPDYARMEQGGKDEEQLEMEMDGAMMEWDEECESRIMYVPSRR